MGILMRENWERFAKGLSEGLTQDKAFVAAGYSPNSARVGACTLLKKHPEIWKRVEEIKKEKSDMFATAGIVPVAEACHELGISKKRILAELFDNAMSAKAAVPVVKNGEPTGFYSANWAASNQAFQLLGKELGMFHDNKEVVAGEHDSKTDEELKLFIVEKYQRLGLDITPLVEKVEE
jgi:hypothetical protein